MEDTCVGERCWFYLLVKELVGSGVDLEFKNCPFYQEMIFTPDPIGERAKSAKVIKDCVNRRSLLFTLEELYPRMRGVQSSQEEMRNRTSEATRVFSDILKILPRKPIITIEGDKERIGG